MKSFNEYLVEGIAYASGRWLDFDKQNLEHSNNKLRVYSGIRMGETIFETQIKFRGKWQTVQYSDNMEEALNPKERPLNRNRTKSIATQKQQSWYKRATDRGHTSKDIFGED
jgi:hypothetical protein